MTQDISSRLSIARIFHESLHNVNTLFVLSAHKPLQATVKRLYYSNSP